MPQQTNLNVSPYFDDFDINSSYYKVLFKPGYPVQARELTTLQSILQNQIEQFGSHFFKEGSVVIPGNITYRNDLDVVILEDEYQGISPELYLPFLSNKKIRGEKSGVTAIINSYISKSVSQIQKTTLYVSYLGADSNSGSSFRFEDGENILIDENTSTVGKFSDDEITFQVGERIATTVSSNSTAVGSAVFLESGVYFLRGYFVNVYKDILFLDQYSNEPSYKVGFKVFEDSVDSYDDPSLTDNAQQFNNYLAPGADRFKIFARLEKISLDSTEVENFVQLLEVRNGRLISINNTPEYNIIRQEFARRTYDESGDYYVSAPSVLSKETLNNLKGNDGIFYENQLTYNNNISSEDLGTYQISPFKAYVRGYEVETISPKFLDFPKPRTTKTLENQSINYFTGSTYTLNRVYGAPIIGFSTDYTISLRDSRIGINQSSAPGNEIGLARVYDFALESGAYNASLDQNQWDITLFDIQTYTNIELNEAVTLKTPTHIKGSQSGAIGYLRSDVTDSRNLVVYNSKGNFSIGEKLFFDGIENSRVTTKVRAYSPSDVKSVYGIVGTSYTFTADTLQTELVNIGQVNITASSSGISTVTSTNVNFVGIASIGNIVSFSNPGLSIITYSKVESVSPNLLTISGVTTVTGVCDGALPSSTINPSDFKILLTKLPSSLDSTLYSSLPKKNISSVDLTNSHLTIRKQFDVTIVSNSISSIDTLSQDETFLPFDEERYVLIRENGSIEPLSSDKFVFENGSRTLTINGLSSNGPAKLIATVRKINIKSKIKNKNRIKTILIDKSKYAGSGTNVGTSNTTLNDGLIYGNYSYGTRVQDEEICLLEPDVTKIYGIFESNDVTNPDLPSIIFSTLNGPTNKTNDLLIGEEFVGKISQAVGIYVERNSDSTISFNYLNSNNFIRGEEILFKESKVIGYISSINNGDKNITSSFTLDSGLKDTIYDFSKIIRNNTSKEPTKKIKIVFESANISSSDVGDLITTNSYDQFNYCDIGSTNNIRNSDILDIRPRVSKESVANRSPFEFLGRKFNSPENTTTSILASDESILLTYSFYLPRIDKICVSKDGSFQLNMGIPSENPQEPVSLDDSLDIATVFLPAYLCNSKDVNINLRQHKRYRMSDISTLENRIKNLEYYTSLSLLEKDTSNLLIQDSNGLNRFKSGFFVDDFSTTLTQQKTTIVKNSIDVLNSELRPTHYTTSIDLLPGTNSSLGVGPNVNPLFDLRTDTELIGSGVRKTGQLVTLDYTERPFITQPFSTRVENVTPYYSSYFEGTIELSPSSDTWVDQVQTSPKNISEEGNYTQTLNQLVAQGFDSQTGFGPVIWNSWETEWTTSAFYYRAGESSREGTRQVLKEDFVSKSSGNKVIDTKTIPYLRSRNVEFSCKRLRPFTRLYSFFDGIDVNKFIIPKLIEITMTNGVFQVGEKVIGYFDDGNSNSARISFRVSQQNHKYGTYNDPSEIYTFNPYIGNENGASFIPSSYSLTSTILNVDTYSLSSQVQGEYSGYIAPSMKLKGTLSGAEAVVSDVKLVTDSYGVIIGSFYIPNGNIDVNPRFEAGTKIFRLTSSPTNSQIVGSTISAAEEKFFVEGKVETLQENIIVTRNARMESQSMTETKDIKELLSNVSSVYHVFDNTADRSLELRWTGAIVNVTAESPGAPDSIVSTDFSAKHYKVTFNVESESIKITPGTQAAGGAYDSGMNTAKILREDAFTYRIWFNRASGYNTYIRSFDITLSNVSGSPTLETSSSLTSSPSPSPSLTYSGNAGGVDQNAGSAAANTYNSGNPTFGTGALQRALADGYSTASIISWINSSGAAVGKDAAAALGIKCRGVGCG